MTPLLNSFYMNSTVSKPYHDPFAATKAECSRLLHAAVINKQFRKMLLANPVKSIETGYFGETFQFTREEKERVRSINASTLEEFAYKLMQMVEAPVMSEMPCYSEK